MLLLYGDKILLLKIARKNYRQYSAAPIGDRAFCQPDLMAIETAF
jgi:hypothetical protein